MLTSKLKNILLFFFGLHLRKVSQVFMLKPRWTESYSTYQSIKWAM